MQVISKILMVSSSLGLTSWYGLDPSQNAKPTSDPTHVSQPLIANIITDNLPDRPEEWKGRIDYRSLDQQMARLSKRPEIAGLAVAIIENGKLSFVHAYGVTDRKAGTPVTTKTMFRWASVSKTLTGTLAATLAQKKIIDLKSPIASWSTSLRLPQGAEKRVTFEQLLSHQVGLHRNANDHGLENGESPDKLRASLANAPVECAPGTCHRYQNIAFDTAGEILALEERKPFTDAVTERFFRPLGMTSAKFGKAGLTEAEDWARPYGPDGRFTIREAYWRVPAAAGVESNIVDFARWMHAAMGERPDVLPQAALNIAQAPRTVTDELYGGKLRKSLVNPEYGLGWRSFSYTGHRLVSHSGGVNGYRAMMVFDPEARTGVVALWNTSWGGPFRIPFAVLDSYYKRKGSVWLDCQDPRLSADCG